MAITPARNGIAQSTAGTNEETAWVSSEWVQLSGIAGSQLGGGCRQLQVRCTAGTALIRVDPISSGGFHAPNSPGTGNQCKITTTDDWVTFTSPHGCLPIMGLFIAGSGAACTCDWRMTGG